MLNSKHDARDLCLSFANTVHWHASNQPRETLHSYTDLLTWLHSQQYLSGKEAAQLAQKAHHEPRAAAEILQRALTLRETLYRIFVAHIYEGRPQEEDLVRLNQEFSLTSVHLQLATQANGFVLRWDDDVLPLERVLWPIVRSATELLTSEALLARVGQCADDRGCGWLFLDMSKNRSRQWCDINDCGNRAKQRRYVQRERENRKK